MKLERGMIISPGSTEWFTVVNIVFKAEKVWMECLCDCANNTYLWEPKDIVAYLSVEEISSFGYDSWPERQIPKHLRERGIPHEIIVEVIFGKHNSRF